MLWRDSKARTPFAALLCVGLAAIAFALVSCGSGDGSGDEASGADLANAAPATTAKAATTKTAAVRRASKRRKKKFRPRPAKLQKRGSMNRIKPRPRGKHSRGDRGAIWDRGCMMLPPQTRSKPCVFGRRKGKKKMVLFGDSHAMHLFGAVNRLAKRRGWKLIAQTKAGCPPSETRVYNNKVDGVYRQCQKWHRNALRRIERARPNLIIVGIARSYKPMRKGKQISAKRPRARALIDGYRSMLERLQPMAKRVVAIRDLPMAPHDMTDCVGAHLKHLRKCSWRKPKVYGKTWESRAVRGVKGVDELDFSRAICKKRRCFGVIRNKLVYRDNDHMTATFSRTLAPWVARGLRRGR